MTRSLERAVRGTAIGGALLTWIFCVDIRIDAAPPPVLTPGQAALFPVDVRLRFIDGVELPGRQAVVTVTATRGTVTPAGGVVTLPLAANLTLLPTAPGSTVLSALR